MTDGQDLKKKTLRRQLKRALRAMTPQSRAAQSAVINLQIQEMWVGGSVLLYAALPDEVNLDTSIQAAVRQYGSCVLPRVDGSTLSLHRISHPESQLVVSAYGIREPIPSTPLVSPESLTTAIIPGVGFTNAGGRLGRGGGFYDRILPQIACCTWGVAFDEQIVDHVPQDAHDQPVDRVIHRKRPRLRGLC